MNERAWSIRAHGLSKKFGLTLRQSMKYGLRDAARRLTGRHVDSEVARDGEFWAVRDVSFELREGQALGIMGVNGSGKTTLLRILNGVYAPDAGRVQLRGRVGALIAAGAGFAPMLSGRENVYVNGALLGLTTKQVDSLMDEIVAFAELGPFIDLPVKNYSSGMFVRLGFAVAALSAPDILLMDEVLAVGDLNFQKKCFDYIHQLKRHGTSIILVSHSPGAIWSVCDRGLFMDKGQALIAGSTEDVIRAYEDQNARNAVTSGEQFAHAVEAHEKAGDDGGATAAIASDYGHTRGGTGDASCSAVRVLDPSSGAPCSEIGFGEPFLIEADLQLRVPIRELLVRFTIDAAHYRFIATLDNHEQGLDFPLVEAGSYRARVAVPSQNLRPGAYSINVCLVRKGVGVHLFYWHGAVRFLVCHPHDRFLYSDHNAILHLDARFELEPSTAGLASMRSHAAIRNNVA